MKKSILTLAIVTLIAGGTSAIGGELRAQGRSGYRYVSDDKNETTVAVYTRERDIQIRGRAHRGDNNRSRLNVNQGRSGYSRAVSR